MNRPILVTGFGDFPGVTDNPAARLALAIDGAEVAGVPVVGRVIPVRWRHGPDEAITLARSLDARLVLGLGVAMARSGVEVEARAVRAVDGRPDAAGEVCDLPEGVAEQAATLDVAKLAHALGAAVSTDAGRYVCNAWLFQVAGALLDRPVGFVHLPPCGLERDRLLVGLSALLNGTAFS